MSLPGGITNAKTGRDNEHGAFPEKKGQWQKGEVDRKRRGWKSSEEWAAASLEAQ